MGYWAAVADVHTQADFKSLIGKRESAVMLETWLMEDLCGYGVSEPAAVNRVMEELAVVADESGELPLHALLVTFEVDDGRVIKNVAARKVALETCYTVTVRWYGNGVVPGFVTLEV